MYDDNGYFPRTYMCIYTLTGEQVNAYLSNFYFLHIYIHARLFIEDASTATNKRNANILEEKEETEIKKKTTQWQKLTD